MGLASMGAAPPIDPAALFGAAGPQLGKVVWQAPRSENTGLRSQRKDTQTKGDDTSSWLERVGLRTTPAPTQPIFEDEDEREAEIIIRRMRSQWGPLEKWLELRKPLETIPVKGLGWLARRADRLGLDRLEFCERAFRSLLWDYELRWEHILEFMLNPELNVPDARHLTYLVSQLGRRFLTREEFAATKKLVHGCLKLGVVSNDEVPELIRAAFDSVPFVWKSMMYISKEVRHEDMPESLIETIWRGLCECPIKQDHSQYARLILELLPRRRSLQAFRYDLYIGAYPVKFKVNELPTTSKYLADWAIQACGIKNTSHMNVGIFIDVLDDLCPGKVTTQDLVAATDILLARRTEFGIDEDHSADTIMAGWLNCLQKALAYRVWSPVLAFLARKEVSPLEVSEIFTRLAPRHLICEALLLYWLPLLPHYQVRSETLKSKSLHYDDSTKAHHRSIAQRKNALDRVLADYRFLHQQNRSPCAYDAFAFLLIALHRHQQYTLINHQMILGLAEHLFGATGLAEVCDHARSAGVYLYPQSVHEIISRIATAQPRAALSLWKSRKIGMRDMRTFLRALIDDGVHSIEIFRILSFEDPAHFVPLEDRADKKNAMTPLRVQLIHECAEAFSERPISKHKESLRVALRNVHACYLYLTDRDAPIDPMLSRALVRAGITNYLQMGINVAQTQVKWVLSVVEKVEGAEVARELDELVARWSEKVYMQWNDKNGGTGSTREKTVMLRARLERTKHGLLRHRQNYAWKRDRAEIGRKFRWYLQDGTFKHTDLDLVFQKRLRTQMQRQLPREASKPTAWQEKTMQSAPADEMSWQPSKGFELQFKQVIDGETIEGVGEEWEDIHGTSAWPARST